MQSRKIIPNLATWIQCFSIYAATLSAKRMPQLMAYQTIIAKASQRYRWPSWVVYDQNFRKEAAGNPHQSWARVDPSIYAQCFTGQAISNENWCTRCQCLDHATSSCPYRPRKKPWNSVGGTALQGKQEQPICIKYNKFNGDCKFGKECRYLHVCSSCKEPTPSRAARSGKKLAMLPTSENSKCRTWHLCYNFFLASVPDWYLPVNYIIIILSLQSVKNLTRGKGSSSTSRWAQGRQRDE